MSQIENGENLASVREKINQINSAVSGRDAFYVADTIADMAGRQGISDGASIRVNSGFQSEAEFFTYDLTSSLPVDGAVIVDATGMGFGRWISTRTSYASFSEMISDNRAFNAGTFIEIPSIGAAYEATDGSGSLGQASAGGQQFDVVRSAPVEAFGAVGDGVTSDTSAFIAALSSGLRVTSLPNKVYLIDGGVSLSDVNVYFYPDPSSTIKMSGNNAQISMTYGYSAIQSIATVDNTASINMNDGTGGTSTPCTMLTVSDGSAYAAGDNVKIVSDDTITGTDPSDSLFRGEHAEVFSVSGNDVYLRRRLRVDSGAYTTNPRIAKGSSLVCRLGHLNIDGARDEATGRSGSYIRPVGCMDLSCEFIKSDSTQGPAISLTSCFRPKIGGGDFSNGKTIAASGAFAHGVLAVSCTDVDVGSIRGRDMRHLFDTGAQACSANDAVSRYGGTVGGVVASIFGEGMQAPPLSTHADSEGIRFEGVVSLSPIHGPNGYFGAAGLRGRNHHVEYAECEGGDGVRVFTDYASDSNSTGHTIGDVVLRSNGEHNQQRAVYVLGQSGGDVGTIPVRSITWKASNDDNTSPIIRVKYGKVLVSDLISQGSCETTTTSLIYADTDGEVEVLKWTGRDMGIFQGADIVTDTSSVTIHKLDFETDTTPWGSFADLNSNDGAFLLADARINQRGTAENLVLNKGSGADVKVSWVIDGETGSRSNFRLPTLTISSSTNYSVDQGDAYADVLMLNVLTTASGGSINSFTDGQFLGQRIMVVNKYDPSNSSTNSFDLVDNGSGNIRTGASNYTVVSGRGIILYWDGFDWRLTS